MVNCILYFNWFHYAEADHFVFKSGLPLLFAALSTIRLKEQNKEKSNQATKVLYITFNCFLFSLV